MALFIQFVLPTAIEQAAKEYQSARFGTDVFEWYTRLELAANNMVQPLDPYSFKMKFLKGLPRDINDQVLLFSHTPEASSMKELFDAVIQAKQTQRNRVRFTTEGRQRLPTRPQWG